MIFVAQKSLNKFKKMAQYFQNQMTTKKFSNKNTASELSYIYVCENKNKKKLVTCHFNQKIQNIFKLDFLRVRK